VTDCCNGRGCDSFFGDRFSGRAAKRYRKRGLDKNARRIVAFLEQRGIRDAAVLEIGGGIGEIQIELLTHGAAHAVNLELSPHYDDDARTLLREHGLEDRVDRRLCDIAVNPGDVEPADVVILHRVVCCYPDYDPLLTAVAAHARRLVVFSYPPRNVPARLAVAFANLRLRLRRSEFRVFAHPPEALLTTLAQHGLRPNYSHHGLAWNIAGLERATDA
jgi:magnesium-protoporphyrin O-methyltransferase